MTCVGWKKPNNCGRQDQIVAPGATCPSIVWFYAAAAAILLGALLKKS